MNTIESSESELDQQILESVADALLVLSNVGYGDYSTRLELRDGDSSPLASLYAGINDMIAALGVEQEKNRRYQEDLEGKLATIERQRGLLRSRFTSSNPIAALLRWLLTIGALLWFPLIQPLLEAGVKARRRASGSSKAMPSANLNGCRAIFASVVA